MDLRLGKGLMNRIKNFGADSKTHSSIQIMISHTTTFVPNFLHMYIYTCIYVYIYIEFEFYFYMMIFDNLYFFFTLA